MLSDMFSISFRTFRTNFQKIPFFLLKSLAPTRLYGGLCMCWLILAVLVVLPGRTDAYFEDQVTQLGFPMVMAQNGGENKRNVGMATTFPECFCSKI